MAEKPIRISPHARFEMQRRGINEREIFSTIRQPGKILESRKGRRIYQVKLGRLGRLLLRVVAKEDAHAYHVVTAYKTSKVAKYWQPE